MILPSQPNLQVAWLVLAQHDGCIALFVRLGVPPWFEVFSLVGLLPLLFGLFPTICKHNKQGNISY